MAGRRRQSLNDILGQTEPEAATEDVVAPPAPAEAPSGSSAVPWNLVAPNPLNARDVHAHPERLAELAESLRQHGQIEACTAVTKAAFVAIFPELADAAQEAQYVQVSGGRRRAAVRLAGIDTLDVAVKDHLAETRAVFIAATLAENADREDLDPIEEAHQVALLVKEVGTGRSAAEQLGRTGAWVSQRMNLLKLVEEVRDAVRGGEMPVREVRTLHLAERAEQLAALRHWRALVAARERRREQGEQQSPAARPTPVARAIQRLGGSPAAIAASLRAELSPDDRRALAEDLLREDDT